LRQLLPGPPPPGWHLEARRQEQLENLRRTEVAPVGHAGNSATRIALSAKAFSSAGAAAAMGIVADLEGLARRNWLLALGMTVFMLSLAGFPPSVGFFGKLFLFTAGVGAGYTWLVVLALLMSVVSVFYYVRVLIPIWSPSPRLDGVPASFSSRFAIGISVAASVGLGVYPTTLLIAGQLGAIPIIPSP